VCLTIVKQIVEAHEGKIEVESKLDKGTNFRIQLKRFPSKVFESNKIVSETNSQESNKSVSKVSV